MGEVKCNMCQWCGYEEDLEMIEGQTFSIPNGKTDTEFFKGCPECKTDAYLMDVEQLEKGGK